MPKPGYVYVVDSNNILLDDLAARIEPNIEGNRPIGLIHLADEWYRGNYKSYRLYDFVIRTYHAKRLEKSGVFIAPLGWPNNGEGANAVKLATDRALKWCFAGNLISSRFEMVREFQSWRPNICELSNDESVTKKLSLPKERYIEVLNDAVFCPAPMGNVMTETWRLYEALEAGCIPLIERRLTMDYYNNLFGKNPIPRFKRWRDARVFAESLAGNPKALVEVQDEIRQWWSGYKRLLTKRTEQFVSDGLLGSFREELSRWRFPSGPVAKIWQVSELVRHHSPEALAWRVNRTITKGIGAMFQSSR
jgi:hypothetical protein